MRRESIRSIIMKNYRVTTNSNHKYPVVENKLMKQFADKEKNDVGYQILLMRAKSTARFI